jgi:hypothetical protein
MTFTYLTLDIKNSSLNCPLIFLMSRQVFSLLSLMTATTLTKRVSLPLLSLFLVHLSPEKIGQI